MKLTRILTTILLTIFINLSIINPSNALYTEDLTITGTNGIWTDVRSYISLSDAIAAIGSKQQTLLIPTEVTCSDLTIPSNITLKFVKTGAINNSGTLTIQTTNIIAGHNQIFTGSGSINFADNTEVLTSWFSSLYNAINQTSNDKVCLIIDKQYTLSTSISLGNNIILKFSSPVSTISTNSSVTLSNISKVISSKGIIFTGSGDFDFTQGSIIHTSWFTSFRRAITYTSDDNVLETLLLDSDGSLDTNATINSYTTLKVLKGYYITIPSSLTLTINGNIDAGNYQIFFGDGNIIFPDNLELKSSWFSSFETAIAKINSAKVNLIVTSPATISNNCTINNNISLSIPYPNRILTISSGKTLTINGFFKAGSYQIFAGDGNIDFQDGMSLDLNWFSSLSKAVNKINNSKVSLHITRSETLTSALDIPENITLVWTTAGNHITTDSNNLNIYGCVIAPALKIFDTTDQVHFYTTTDYDIYPEWFGAVANGTTDCSTAINATIHAANTRMGGTIHFRSGTYRVNSPLADITNSVTIEGEGWSSTIIRFYDDTDDMFSIKSVYPVNFINLRVDANDINKTAGALIVYRGSEDTNWNRFSVIQQVYVGETYMGIHFVSASGWAVRHCYFVNNNTALTIENTASPDTGDSSVMGCTFDNESTSGCQAIRQFSSGGLRVIGNKFLRYGKGISVEIEPDVSTSILIVKGNSFEHQGEYGINVIENSDGSFSQVIIVGNQFNVGSTADAIRIDAASGQTVNHVVVTSNYIQITGNSQFAVLLEKVQNFLVLGNRINGILGGVGIGIGPNSRQGFCGGNYFRGLTNNYSNNGTNTYIGLTDANHLDGITIQ